MNFLSDFFGSLFGKKRKDEEQPRAAQPVRRAAPVLAPTQFTPISQISGREPEPQAQKTPELNLMSLTQKLPKVSQEVQELNKLAEANRKKGNDEAWARTMAAKEYQKRVGGTPNAEVQKYMNDTLAINERQAAKGKKDSEAGANFWGGVANISNVMGNLPVVSSLSKPVTQIIQKGARSVGANQLADSAQDVGRRMSLGMSDQEFQALPEDQRTKLGILQGADTVFAPTDLLGLSSLAKLPIKAALKEGATDLVKAGAKQQVKQAAIGGAVGAGATAGVQQWLSGEVDPLDVLRGGATTAGLSVLTNPFTNSARNLTKVEAGVNSVNPARTQVGKPMPGVQPNLNSATPPLPAPSSVVQPGQPIPNTQNWLQSIAPEAPLGPSVLPTPQNVGELDAQIRTAGGIQLPDRMFDADARVALPTVDELLETPAFLRRNAPDIMDAANQQMSNADFTINQLASLDPEYVANSRNIDPVTGSIAAARERQSASAILNMARKAQADQEQLNASGVFDTGLLSKAPEISTSPQEVIPPQFDEAGMRVAAEEITPAPAVIPETVPPVVEAVPDPTPIVPDPAPVQPQQVVDQPPVQAQDTSLPVASAAPGPTVPVAPNTHDALVKSLGDAPVAKELKGAYGQRESVAINDLLQNGERAVEQLDEPSLINAFQTTETSKMVTDERSYAVAKAALRKLANSDDPASNAVVSNIMDAMEQYSSRGGLALRLTQEAFDTLTIPQKVRYIVKKIDRANQNDPNYQPLADNPAKASLIEAELTQRLQASQNIAEQVAALEGRVQQVTDNPTVKSGENFGDLRRQLQTLKRNLASQNGETVKYFTELVPGRSVAQKALTDFPRTMMLASFTGRVNDVLTTTANVGNLSVQNAIQGGLSKAVNTFKPGLVTDTSKGGRRLFTGAIEGLRKTGMEVRGKQFAPDLEQGLKGNVELRSGLTKSKNPFNRTVQAATELATNITEGVRDQRVYQLADQEAMKLGLKGDLRTQYAEARSLVPSRHMLEQAEILHKEINNLNENPVTTSLNRVAAAIQGDSAIGGLIKNQVMPFTSWAGGNIYNNITDKNVVANAIKIVDSARKGDAEGIVRNVSKLANNSAQTYALGYLLTQMGLITNEDANGYNDAGAYFHIGDRYIPANFLGFAAPNVILGNALYNGLNGDDENPAAAVAGQASMNLLKSINLFGAFGQESNLIKSMQAATRQGGEIWDGAATFIGGAAGQFIPAMTGDANAVLNNQTDLNPTREASDTKVVDPNSPSGQATDVPATVVNQLKNRIPFVSQTLPRKEGRAADDLFDRTVRGNRDTETTKTAREVAKTAEETSKDLAARGVPDFTRERKNGEASFEDEVKARVEEGNYDKAIEGLKAKYDFLKADKNTPASKLKDKETEITRLEVVRDNKIGPNTMGLYFGKGADGIELEEWRAMGDPDDEAYNPQLYQLLYDLDSAFAEKGVSRNTTDPSKPFYYAKKAKGSGSGRGGGSRANGNTIGSITDLGRVSFGKLTGKQTGTAPLPTITKLRTNELAKKRKISVS